MADKHDIKEVVQLLRSITSVSLDAGEIINRCIRILDAPPRKRGTAGEAEEAASLVGAWPHKFLADAGHMDTADMVPLLKAMGAPYANKADAFLLKGCQRKLSKDRTAKCYVEDPSGHWWTADAWKGKTTPPRPQLVPSA